MKRELDIKMELEGAKQQLGIQENKYRKSKLYHHSDEAIELRAYINKLIGRIWALEFVLD